MATAPCWGKGKKAAATPSVRRLDPEARGLRFLADPAAASRHGSGPVWMWRGSSCRAFASARSFHPLSGFFGLGLLSSSGSRGGGFEPMYSS